MTGAPSRGGGRGELHEMRRVYGVRLRQKITSNTNVSRFPRRHAQPDRRPRIGGGIAARLAERYVVRDPYRWEYVRRCRGVVCSRDPYWWKYVH
jgi:hypothetical protein